MRQSPRPSGAFLAEATRGLILIAALHEPGIIAVFDAWLVEARACGVRVVESFTASLAQDEATVRAGLRLPWSSGQDEGRSTASSCSSAPCTGAPSST